jgi:TolB-like protein/Tfp pilus assembly protein PilF
LKPSNIMIDREGTVRIMDFGIARLLKAQGTTRPGTMIGTPEYMSPEQVEGKELDYRSDVYSLGVIVYEMVTGRAPFQGDTPVMIGLKHVKEIPQDPREFNPQIPEELSRLILRCLEKEKEKRPETARVLLSELNEIELKKPLPGKTSEMKGKITIAVLPFTDMSPQLDQEYFCDGLTEELINTLTKIERLQVASRTASFQFKGKGYDIIELGKKLKVQNVLEGSVRKAGNRLRITAQLVNIASGYHLWSEKYDRDLEDIFSIQDEISLAIVDKLKIKLFGEEKARLVKHFTDDLEAYNTYLKGRYFWNKRTGESIKKAIEYFKRAIERDPSYAMAYSGLADAYLLLPYYSSFPPKAAYPKAKEATTKALEIDDKIAEAHTSMGFIRSLYDFDWGDSEKEYKKAIAINPNYALAHFWYAWNLLWRKRFEEAAEKMKFALDLEPLSLVINCDLGLCYYFTRRYDQAIEQYRRALEIDPSFSYAHLFLGWAYIQKAQYAEALAEFQNEKEYSGGWDPVVVDTWIGIASAKMGDEIKANKILDELQETSKLTYVSSYHIGFLHYVLGQTDQAFEWLEKAYEERDFWLCWLNIEPIFDDVRSDPRYLGLIQKLKLD